MQVKRVSLELGGKAPFVVFDDADVEAAARAAIFGMFRNAGQACGATTRLLLHEGIHDRFLSRVLELTSQIDVGHPADQFTDMGPLISSSQEKIVLDYIKLGQDAGFELVTGGEKLTGGEYDHGYYVEPTIFDRVDNSSSLSQEEIFGPVVTVTTFQEEDEAIELANAVDFGLVAGVWSTDYPGPSEWLDAFVRAPCGFGTTTPNRWKESGAALSKAASGESLATTGWTTF